MQQKVATLALISTYQFKSKTSRKEKALVNAHAIFDKENGCFMPLQQQFCWFMGFKYSNLVSMSVSLISSEDDEPFR